MDCIMIDAGEANAGYRSAWIWVLDDSSSTRTSTSNWFAGEAYTTKAISVGVSPAKTAPRITAVVTILAAMTRALGSV
jgi:hypothetical protein